MSDAKRIAALRQKLDELSRRGSSAQFFSPLSNAALAVFESETAIALPEPYRAFLLDVSSGLPGSRARRLKSST